MAAIPTSLGLKLMFKSVNEIPNIFLSVCTTASTNKYRLKFHAFFFFRFEMELSVVLISKDYLYHKYLA